MGTAAAMALLTAVAVQQRFSASWTPLIGRPARS